MEARFLLIYRAERFSPNAVDRDKAMLDEVARQLKASFGAEVSMLHEHELAEASASGNASDNASGYADYAGFTIVHMTRSAEALTKLDAMQSNGARILNPPSAIRAVNRANIEAAMAANGLPTPARLIEMHPELGGKGWWIKANDTTDSSPSHIQFHELLPQELAVKDQDLLVQPHIEGQNIKFYGVRGTEFFKVREDIPSETLQQLRTSANILADALSLDIYGGDAILTDSGLLTIIDFNDFPSFSSCREEAAKAILGLCIDSTHN